MAVEVPEQVIKDFLARGGEVEYLDPPLATAAPEPEPEPAPATALESGSVEKPKGKAKEAEIPATEQARQAARQVGEAIAEPVRIAHDKITSMPTPGGIALLLLALLFLAWVVVSFNGHTRLAWLWYVLTGRARLKGRKKLDVSVPEWVDPDSSAGDGGGGGGSGFGLAADAENAPIELSDEDYDPLGLSFTSAAVLDLDGEPITW